MTKNLNISLRDMFVDYSCLYHLKKTRRIPDLEKVTHTKYLGVALDDRLSYTIHVYSLYSEFSTVLYLIRRLKNICDTMSAKVTYHALFESHLRYGIAVLGVSVAGNLQRIIVFQNRAIRLLCSLKSRGTSQELKILTVPQLVHPGSNNPRLHLGATISKKRIKNPPTKYKTWWNYCLPIHKLSYTEKKINFIGAKTWNAKPEKFNKIEKRRFGQRL